MYYQSKLFYFYEQKTLKRAPFKRKLTFLEKKLKLRSECLSDFRRGCLQRLPGRPGSSTATGTVSCFLLIFCFLFRCRQCRRSHIEEGCSGQHYHLRLVLDSLLSKRRGPCLSPQLYMKSEKGSHLLKPCVNPWTSPKRGGATGLVSLSHVLSSVQLLALHLLVPHSKVSVGQCPIGKAILQIKNNVYLLEKCYPRRSVEETGFNKQPDPVLSSSLFIIIIIVIIMLIFVSLLLMTSQPIQCSQLYPSPDLHQNLWPMLLNSLVFFLRTYGLQD